MAGLCFGGVPCFVMELVISLTVAGEVQSATVLALRMTEPPDFADNFAQARKFNLQGGGAAITGSLKPKGDVEVARRCGAGSAQPAYWAV